MSTNPPRADRFLKNPGKSYTPSAGAWAGYGSHVLDGTPIFNWLDVPRMIRDPQIQFGLRMLRSPFGQVKWVVRSDRQAVADFVDSNLRRFWDRIVPKLLMRYFMWGYGASTLEYSAGKRIRLKRGKIIEPRDVQPLTFSEGCRHGEFAGFKLTSQVGVNEPQTVLKPHAIWFAGHEELGHLYDRPRVAGAFEPWLEKNGRNGARASCRLWYRTRAITPGVLYYPPGDTNVGTDASPVPRNNQDIAREQGEAIENGSMLFVPNILTADGGKRAWEYEPSRSQADAAGILEYPKELDRQILIGLGIPPEVIEAAATGSGFSGRKIPAMAYLGSADELVGQLIECAEETFLRDLVRHNFGKKSQYEIQAKSLVEILMDDGKQSSAPTGPPPPPSPPQMQEGQDDPLAGLLGGSGDGADPKSGGVPYQGKRGGVGIKDPVTGRVKYGANLSQVGTDPSKAAAARDYAAAALKRLTTPKA